MGWEVHVVTELLDGPDLEAPTPPPSPSPSPAPAWEAYVEEGGPLSEGTTALLATHVGAALQHLHAELNAMHRDLKPANIVCLAEGKRSAEITRFVVSAQGGARHPPPPPPGR
jgi:serine/threonine protein kinase